MNFFVRFIFGGRFAIHTKRIFRICFEESLQQRLVIRSELDSAQTQNGRMWQLRQVLGRHDTSTINGNNF